MNLKNKLKLNSLFIKNFLGVLILLVTFGLLIKLFLLSFSTDIWYDEVFSIGFLNHSYLEILQLTSTDVHPPLYYWYLKTVIFIGNFIFPSINPIIFSKLASLFPMIGLGIISVTVIRKQFGIFCSSLFFFCILTMPQLASYSLEIRMYSFALFWVTTAFLFSLKIISSNDSFSYLGLLISGIITAYTQYFSCVAIIILYIILGLFLFLNKRDLKKWIFNIVVSVFCYLPWLPIIYKQFNTIHGSYWIPPLNWRSYLGSIKFIYLPSGGYPIINYILAILLICSTIIFFFLFFYKKIKEKTIRDLDNNTFLLLSGFGITLGLIIFGVTASIFVSPIFVYRYLIPTLGVFWFAFSFLLSDNKNVFLWVPILILTLSVGFINIKGFFWEENMKTTEMQNSLQLFDFIEPNDILIFNFNHPQAVLGIYLSNDSYLLFQEAEPLIQTLYGDYGTINEITEIKELLKNGNSIKFIGSFESREDLIKEWETEGIHSTLEGSYLIERYWVNLYSLSL